MLYNFHTKPKQRQRKCNIPSAVLNLRKVRFGITTQVENSRSNKRSSLAVQDFNLHLKFTGKKVQSSLKPEDPSYANIKQFSRFVKNSDLPPKPFPVTTHTLYRAEILTYLFSTILVRAAAVGINNYKHRTELSFCKIHQEESATHTKELVRC